MPSDDGHVVSEDVDALLPNMDGEAPGGKAKEVIEACGEGGGKAILNYAPIAAHAPPDVRIKDIDPVLALQSMTFYIKDSGAKS